VESNAKMSDIGIRFVPTLLPYTSTFGHPIPHFAM
jgi:hypothetical protein